MIFGKKPKRKLDQLISEFFISTISDKDYKLAFERSGVVPKTDIDHAATEFIYFTMGMYMIFLMQLQLNEGIIDGVPKQSELDSKAIAQAYRTGLAFACKEYFGEEDLKEAYERFSRSVDPYIKIGMSSFRDNHFMFAESATLMKEEYIKRAVINATEPQVQVFSEFCDDMFDYFNKVQRDHISKFSVTA